MNRTALVVESLPGGPLEIPYFELVGRGGPGPHVTVIAGIHGGEYTGMRAITRFVAAIDEDRLRGTITAVPIVNVPAFRARSAFVVPQDGLNLNRAFPGDPGGSYTQVLAHAVFTAFIQPTDYLIDLHAGDIFESLQPFHLYEESDVEERSLALARSYGLPWVMRQSRAGRTVGGSTSAAAADIGVPAIIAEVGGNGLCDDASVERHVAGLHAVFADLGMLPAVAHEPWEPQTESPGWEWLRTPAAGWWQPAVAVGATVAEGDLLGSILDPYGDELHRVLAPAPGCPLFVTSSPAVAEDGLLLGLALLPA